MWIWVPGMWRCWTGSRFVFLSKMNLFFSCVQTSGHFPTQDINVTCFTKRRFTEVHVWFWELLWTVDGSKWPECLTLLLWDKLVRGCIIIIIIIIIRINCSFHALRCFGALFNDTASNWFNTFIILRSCFSLLVQDAARMSKIPSLKTGSEQRRRNRSSVCLCPSTASLIFSRRPPHTYLALLISFSLLSFPSAISASFL